MKILFAGDLSFSKLEGFTGQEKTREIYKSVKPVFDSADYRMLNLECVLYDSEEGAIVKSGPCIKGSREYIDHLNFLNVDCLGLANNHIGDYGEKAIFDTTELLEQNNIYYVGAGKNIEESYRSHIFRKDGITVSVIAACENEFGVATDNKAGSAGFNLTRIKNRIEAEKAKSDYVAIFFHGGNEHNPFPSPAKTELYRLFVDFGADSVIAMHTHCPQGYEIYNEKPIVYSMGNFYFPTLPENTVNLNSSWYFGYMVMLDFKADKINMEIFPYKFGSVNDSISLLQNENKSNFLNYLSGLCSPLGNPREIDDLFSIWSTIGGEMYEWCLSFKPEMKNNNSPYTCHYKNIFSCEAHNEMVTRFITLCNNGDFNKFKAMKDKIIRFQNLEKFTTV